ncbi:MAG: DUF4367 domain-containing protein [Clostridia bacterium]|nr:DUF4367 domain-containing protein [Clostridia bacterium]
MNHKTHAKIEHENKLKDIFLYNIAYEHVENICDETDLLLKANDGVEIPETLGKWFTTFHDNYISNQRRFSRKTKVVMLIKRVLVASVLIGLITFTATMSSDAFRVRLLNLVVETKERFTAVSVDSDPPTMGITATPQEWQNEQYPTYIPEGYDFGEVREFGTIKIIEFMNADGKTIVFSRSSVDADYQLNSEGGTVSDITINGNEGILIDNQGLVIVYWHDAQYSYVVHGEEDVATILKVAESVGTE